MSYIDAINYLYSLQKYGIKLGLQKTEKILSCLGNPHRDFLSIHVAGTNGKGSTSAMIASILMAHGFKVGLYTSPHLVSFTERIKINNEQIKESEVVSLTTEIKFKIHPEQVGTKFKIPEPTFFEFVTVMAFLYFARNNVDWAVIEVGMGGRLDATNMVTPEVSVITNISYDHKEFLGETLTEISGEKAGIIKNRVPVVSAEQEKEAENVICKTAEKRGSPLFLYGRDFNGILRLSDISGIAFDYHDSTFNIQHSTLKNLFVPLAGQHQLINACVAIKAAIVALKESNERVTSNEKYDSSQCQSVKDSDALTLGSSDASFVTPHSSLIKDGLAATKWRGRLEIVNHKPLIIVDGAHNPNAATVLAEFIKKHLHNYKIILIMGIMSDKDIKGIMSPILPLASDIIFTAPNYSRAASPQKLAEISLHMGFSSRVANSVKDAIEIAIKDSNKSKTTSNEKSVSSQRQSVKVAKYQSSKDSDALTLGNFDTSKDSSLILITGSFYTIGEAMESLGEKAVLATLRETV